MDSPRDISLVQMAEGCVSIQLNSDDSVPAGATHLKIYLSATPNSLGNLYALVAMNSVDGLFFHVQKGWFGYATVRAYNLPAHNESTNTNQIILQTFEKVCSPQFNIVHFFHDVNTDTQWAIGYRQGDNQVCVIKSADSFTNWHVVSSWPAGQIDNGGMLTFYIDKHGYMYVASRPGAKISKDNGLTWNQLPWSFNNPAEGQITPFWNITEDDANDLIIFSEYGSAFDNSHHATFWSTDPNRNTWQTKQFNWGNYRHIHGYHINPYNPNIHLLFLGDDLSSYGYPNTNTFGYYVSQDAGATWSSEVLNQGGSTFGDGNPRNGPCHTTWWKSGKAFISNDSALTSIAEWWGNGPTVWGYNGLQPRINLFGHVDAFSVWPATPWAAMAVRDGYETYCVSNHDGGAKNGDPNLPYPNHPYVPPSVLWRYDGNPGDDGNTGTITIIAKAYWPAKAFFYMSGGRGNTFPDNADYVFSNAWGGIRIPRKHIRVKRVMGTVLVSQNTPNAFSSSTTIGYSIPKDAVSASLVIANTKGEQLLSYPLEISEDGSIEITPDSLEPGEYYYGLVVNDEMIEQRRMIKSEG